MSNSKQSGLSATCTFTASSFHGKGGAGEVWKARQVELDRDAALKLLKRGGERDSDAEARFLFEAKATSQLDHPGVAPVYAIGETPDGEPFYVMRFISGSTFDSRIQEFHKTDWAIETKGKKRQAFHALLRQLVSASKTIAYAHQRCLLNLDIKPLNIMVGKYGETIVIDWGESLPIDDPKLTSRKTEGPVPVADTNSGSEMRSLSVAGTLPYMAPERLQHRDEPVGPRADIYSLGATLYQVLSGFEPFTSDSPSGNELRMRILQGRLMAPSHLNPIAEVPVQLEAICRKAMHLDTAGRYTNALEFARDIERWLDDEPVTAHAESRIDKLGRWSRRHQTSMWAIGGVLTSVIAVLSIMSMMLVQAWDTSEAARLDNLHLAAGATSQLVSRAFEERFMILEEITGDSELRSRFAAAQNSWKADGKIKYGAEHQQELQNYLLRIHDERKFQSLAASMVILNDQGVILARVPEEEKTRTDVIGSDFRFRDYFHGGGMDYTAEEALDKKPAAITKRHFSIPFRSRANNSLCVQFTVPVKSGETTIGVLGMAVNVAQFEELKSRDTNHMLVLVDLRKSKIDSSNFSNLILHHPKIVKPDLYQLGDELFDQQLRALLKIHKFNTPDMRVAENSYSRFRDPVVGGMWHCAIEPLRVRLGRVDEREPLDLVVLAQQRLTSTNHADD